MLLPTDQRQTEPSVSEGLGKLGLFVGIILGVCSLLGVFVLAGGDLTTLWSQLIERERAGEEVVTSDLAPSNLGGLAGDLLEDAELSMKKLVLAENLAFRSPVKQSYRYHIESPCSGGSRETGPFYCFKDECIYFDPEFFETLDKNALDGGELAQVYVIGRIMARHVQTMLGISDQIRDQQLELKPFERLRIMAQLDLQADYITGLWVGKSEIARRILKTGELEKAFELVDRVNKALKEEMSEVGVAIAERYDTATVEQRIRWFKLGMESNGLLDHNPFNEKEL